MAGIGEYIHYWQARYQQSGIERSGKQKPNSSRVLGQQRAKFLAQLKRPNNNYAQLEQQLNMIIYPNHQVMSRRKQAALDNKLEELLGEMMLQWSTVWTTKGTAKRSFGGKSSIRLSTIRHLGDSIERIMSTIYQRYNNISEAQAQLQKLNTLLAQVRSFEVEAQRLAASTGKKSITWDELREIDKVTGQKKNQYAINLYDDITNSLQTISKVGYFTAIGNFLEGTIATFDDRLQGKIENKAYGLISEILTGSSPTSFKDNAKLAPNYHGFFTMEDGTKFTLSLKDESDKTMKMDVNLQFNDEQYRITAKNYSLQNSNLVHLRSHPRSLLELLASMTDSTFINHYLNIVTSRKGRGNNGINDSIVTNAHQIAKMLLVGEALAGINQIQGNADTFVLNNRSAKKIIVKPIKDFFIPFQENLFAIYGYDLESQGGAYFNKWVVDPENPVSNPEDATIRVARLLNHLHSAKITVGLNSNQIAW